MKTHGITQDAGFPFLRESSKVGLGFSALAATLPFFHAKLLRVELNVGNPAGRPEVSASRDTSSGVVLGKQHPV